MPILQIRDKDGNFIPINAIKGDDGKSAYEQAKEGGYQGTEQDFIAFLNGVLNAVNAIELDEDHIADRNNPHQVKAEQTGAISKHYPTSADLNTELKKGDNTVTICCYYGDTLNTPYKEGKTACTHGMVMTNAHSTEYGTQFCLPSGDNRTFIRSVSGGQISAWLEIKKQTAQDIGALPIAGGTLTGKTLYFDNGNARLSGGQDYMQMDVFDSPKDDNNRRKLVVNGSKTALKNSVILTTIENGEQNTYTIYGGHNKPTASDVGAVSKNGDTMTGALVINKATNWGQVVMNSPAGHYRAIEADDGRIRLDVRDDKLTTDRRFIDFYSNAGTEGLDNALVLYQVVNGTSTSYPIFHKGNKPTKTYSGNGGNQTVQVGGIGIVAWLVSSDGLQGYVSKNGFMGMNSNGQAANQVSSFITFENGVLTLKNGGLCNASGVQYTVQVL